MSDMFQDQIILVAKFYRITQLDLQQRMQGILTETANGLVTGFVAITCVIFFPGSIWVLLKAYQIILWRLAP